MKILRVFPRKTNMTPTDENVRINCYPDLFASKEETDEIHISVTFTDDLQRAEQLAEKWEKIATVKIGGPATNQRGENFVPGMYLKEGCIITSRGCPNRCWFCSVWRREGNTIRELPITEGWNILDDNILRCSENHVRNVFEMLKKQKHRITFSGGLEAAALKDWHIELFEQIKIDQLFFAYDTPDDLEPLIAAGKKFSETKIKHYQLRTYCLIGFPGDTLEKAELRLKQCIEVGFIPAAMLYDKEKQSRDWKLLQMEFIRPIIIKSKFNTEKYNYDYRK